MKTARMCFFCFCFLVTVCFFPLPLLAKPGISFNRYLIADTGYQENAPIINGKLVVYRRHKEGDVDIFGYNLITKKEFPIIEKPGHQSPGGLFGKYLVYSEETSLDNTDAWIINMATGEDIALTQEPGYQTAADIWGINASYIKGYHCGELFIYNVVTKKSYSTSQYACHPIRMWGSLVIWEKNNVIYGYNLNTKRIFELVTGPNERGAPDIFGKTIVWIELYDNTFEIREKDIFSGKEKSVFKSISSRLAAPCISNRYIGWVDDRGIGAHDIFVENRLTGVAAEITNEGPQQVSPTIPDIWGNSVVWMSWISGNGDIYGADLKTGWEW